MPRRKREPQTIGYVRVSTDEQGDSGLGLEAQESAIRAECDRRGWTLSRIATDVASGASAVGRPGYTEALDALDATGGVLIATKADRLSRSVGDFDGLMKRAARKGWALVVLDLGVDTTTPNGEAMALMGAVFAQLERRLIGQRTREALAAKKRRGERLGRAVVLPDDVRNLVADLRAEGFTFQAIADRLNAQGTPTARGGTRWYPSTVRGVVASVALDREMEALRVSA
jgi:DNA invertase Pin-like site-specific DNA recombinase